MGPTLRLSKVHGSLPLQYVAGFCSLEICKKLLDMKGSNTAVEENDDETVLKSAVGSDHEDVVDVLSTLHKEVGIYDSDQATKRL